MANNCQLFTYMKFHCVQLSHRCIYIAKVRVYKEHSMKDFLCLSAAYSIIMELLCPGIHGAEEDAEDRSLHGSLQEVCPSHRARDRELLPEVGRHRRKRYNILHIFHILSVFTPLASSKFLRAGEYIFSISVSFPV